ncbi:MAG: 3-phosphoshikimate 1-carboxyvinyltransferase [Pirellulales bacterium]
MPDSIEIQPLSKPLAAVARPPGSKSLTNRALVCSALAQGTSTLHGALASDDTAVMIDGLRGLGFEIEEQDDGRKLTVAGHGGSVPARFADLYIGNSGTTVRFLTALAALGEGIYRLHGTPRMHERPIQDLLDALSAIGVDAISEPRTGCPPVMVRADGVRLSQASIRGDVSSQFLSALLMVAPCARGDAPVKIDIVGPLVSKPYVQMTVAVMEAFGAKVACAQDLAHFEIGRTGYQATTYEIEPDASAASYFWAAAAIAGGSVTVRGLTQESLQGDVAFCDCLAQMGCEVRYGRDATTVVGGPLRGIAVDMNAISDTVQTLAAVALFAKGPTEIHGIGHIRHKETDRIGALANELRKLGAHVEERPDGLRIEPAQLKPATIDTYDDHRMAMSLALVGLRQPGVVIRDPGCTAKTYPQFFDDLAALATASN